MALFATLLLPCADATSSDDALLGTINYLLTYVEESNCVFIRNGKEYNSKDAAKHIKTKYDSLRLSIKTLEEFIERAATKSIVSGQLFGYSAPIIPPCQAQTGSWVSYSISARSCLTMRLQSNQCLPGLAVRVGAG